MRAPIFKKHIRLKKPPKRNVRNGIKCWYRKEEDESLLPIIVTDLIKGQTKYFLPRKCWGKIYHIQICE